jgi:hypothetical protein
VEAGKQSRKLGDDPNHAHSRRRPMTPPRRIRRAEPVDTARVKRDIARDHAEHTADSQVVTSGRAGAQESRFRTGRAQASLDRETARRDTLDMARAGKLPALADELEPRKKRRP